MLPRTTPITTLCLATAALLTTAAHAATVTPDRIIPYSGREIQEITIISADITGVKYTPWQSTTTQPKHIPLSEIKEISWGDAGEFRTALAHYENGRWAEALKAIEKLPDTGPRDFWYIPRKNLIHGLCLLKDQKPREALPKFDEIIRRYDRSLYVLEAIDAKTKVHNALKEYQEEADTYAKLDPKNLYDQPTATEPYGKLWQLRGAEGRANALAHIPAEAARAATIYAKLAEVTQKLLADLPDALKGNQAEIDDINQRSLACEVQALLRSEASSEQIRTRIAEIADKIKNKTARLSLYITIADLAMKDAEKIPDENQKKTKYKEALLAYMRVYILYPEQKEERPRAMLGAARASVRAGSPDDKTRAVRLFKEVIAEFPGTDHAKQARQELDALGVR